MPLLCTSGHCRVFIAFQFSHFKRFELVRLAARCRAMSLCLRPATIVLAAFVCLIIGTASGTESGGHCSIIAPTDSVICAGSRMKVHWSLLSPVRTPTYLSTAGDSTRYPLQLGAIHGARLLPVGRFAQQHVSISNEAGDVLCETLVSINPCQPCQPNSDEVLDACGVCGGNSECIGCDGRALSHKLFDRCGICGGSGACTKVVSNGGLTTGRITRASSSASRALHQVHHGPPPTALTHIDLCMKCHCPPPIQRLVRSALTQFCSKTKRILNGTRRRRSRT